MRRFRDALENRSKLIVRAARLLAITVPFGLGLLIPAQSMAQSQAQTIAGAAPAYNYEVASIKPSKSINSRWAAPSDDAFTATGVTLKALIQVAFHVTGDYGLSGGPNWLNSERYDVDAKMDTDVADALKKLSSDDRNLARQHMLQALLADRFGLAFHRETHELSVYTLVIAKNGPKLHVAKPGETYPNGIKLASGPGGPGVMLMMGGPGGSFTITAQAVPLANVLPQLGYNSGRPIMDKTGLTDKYDFTLTFSLDQNASAGAPNGQPPLAAADPTVPSLFTAIQEQLGLKLEPGRGPIEIIVIDHAERPSGN